MVKIYDIADTFELFDSGKLSLDQKGDNFTRGGSTSWFGNVFDEGVEYPLSDLIKGIVTMSAKRCICGSLQSLIGGDEVCIYWYDESKSSSSWYE